MFKTFLTIKSRIIEDLYQLFNESGVFLEEITRPTNAEIEALNVPFMAFQNYINSIKTVNINFK